MSSISINQLPRIEEVNTGDLFLIQTPSSSNTLDFKDLIIGLENTTFANTISTFNTNIEILSADVGSLSAKVDPNTTNIATNTTNIDDLSTFITTNSVVLSAQIFTNKTNIVALSADIDTNATDIDTNTTDIATNVANITELSGALFDTTLTTTNNVNNTHGIPIFINGIEYLILLHEV